MTNVLTFKLRYFYNVVRICLIVLFLDNSGHFISYKDDDNNYVVHYVAASYTPLSLRIKGDNLPRTDELGNIRDYKNKDARVTALQDGSIIIYLEMSQSAFQTFEYALSVIDKLLQHAFLSWSVGNDKRAEWISISLKLYQLPGGMFLNLTAIQYNQKSQTCQVGSILNIKN